MKFDIITLFPQMFEVVLNESILKKARDKGLIDIELHNLRDSATDSHNTVDDTPYGGGTGMVLKVDVIDRAITNIKCQMPNDKISTVILLTPQGEKFNAKMAKELAGEEHLVLICGHYEGFDERVREHLVDRQISIGDYVLTGGELPAMILVDAISRFVPGVLPEGAPDDDSHSFEIDGVPALEHPQYTKPSEYNGWKVPDVLMSGNHQEIAKWRHENLRRTNEK